MVKDRNLWKIFLSITSSKLPTAKAGAAELLPIPLDPNGSPTGPSGTFRAARRFSSQLSLVGSFGSFESRLLGSEKFLALKICRAGSFGAGLAGSLGALWVI